MDKAKLKLNTAAIQPWMVVTGFQIIRWLYDKLSERNKKAEFKLEEISEEKELNNAKSKIQHG